MQVNDSFIDHFKKSQVMQSTSTESSLITLGRAQKLDLLIHLLTNLRQSLVICGPSGIGKTTLLKELEQRKKNDWPMINISASSTLSFEAVQEQLYQFILKNNAEYKNQLLSSILLTLEKQSQKIIIIIDNAGLLVSGLIDMLIQYADSSKCLRFVFSLTHDELVLKKNSDQVIESCHFIELPPLTVQQCRVFLQNLSANPKSGAIISLNAISDSVVERLYQQTQGIPGEIIAALSKVSNYNAVSQFKWRAVLFIVAGVVVVINFFVDSEVIVKKENTITPFVMEKPQVVEISSPIIDPEPDKTNKIVVEPGISSELNIPLVVSKSAVTVGLNANDEKIDLLHAKKIAEKPIVEEQIKESEESNVTDKASNIVIEPSPLVNNITEKLSLIKKTDGDNADKKNAIKSEPDDRQWLLKQPQQHYTIQLMVLSNYNSVVDFIDKNQGLKSNFKFVQFSKQGLKKYVLFYGAFNNAKFATSKMKLLPVKYRKSWIRKFTDLQKQLKK